MPFIPVDNLSTTARHYSSAWCVTSQDNSTENGQLGILITVCEDSSGPDGRRAGSLQIPLLLLLVDTSQISYDIAKWRTQVGRWSETGGIFPPTSGRQRIARGVSSSTAAPGRSSLRNREMAVAKEKRRIPDK